MSGLFTQNETPVPMPTITVDPSLVTPGTVGFVATALLAAVVVLLIWDLLRRIRRVRYRAEVTAQLDAEEAAQEQDAAEAPDAASDTSQEQ